MTALVTQQVTQVGYSVDVPIRVSTIAVELIRSIGSSSLGAGAQQPVMFVITN